MKLSPKPSPSLRVMRLAGILALAALPGFAHAQKTVAPAPGRPNIVIVLLDDAEVEITESMPRLRSLFLEKGVRFTSNIANTPLCGPARAVILSGEYAHNNRVYYNNGEEGGYGPWAKRGYDENNLATRLQAQGYRTGLFGKYVNDFPLGRKETFVPKGWDDFRGVLSDREAHNNRFTLNENGALKVYEARSGGYQTDVLGQRLDSFLRDRKKDDARPFFALLAVSAPHIPPEPAERHLSAFPGEKAPRKPSFDEADLSDKPKALRDQAAAITKAQAEEIDATYRSMKQSLLSVEDAMETLIKTLTETGELTRTYLFFTSDNGWMRGEHRIPAEKYAPYEESIRVPLMVRGPGVPEGVILDQVVGLVDLNSTVLELAGSSASALNESDGRSFAPLLHLKKGERARWRESMLIEHFGGGAPFKVRGYFGLRSARATYVEYATGEKEYYDLAKDPYEMENTAARLDVATLAALHARVAALKGCKGPVCRSAEGTTTLPAR